MDSDDYLKFCQDTYREEFRDRDQFVPRQGFLLTGIVVLGSVLAKFSMPPPPENTIHVRANVHDKGNKQFGANSKPATD